MNKVRKGDNVLVVKGRDKGRTGDVRVVIPPGKKTDKHGRHKDGKVIVTGVNVGKRHMKPRGPQQPGGIVERESPISWANIAVVCTACAQPARVGVRPLPGGGKTRFCKRCNENID